MLRYDDLNVQPSPTPTLYVRSTVVPAARAVHGHRAGTVPAGAALPRLLQMQLAAGHDRRFALMYAEVKRSGVGVGPVLSSHGRRHAVTAESGSASRGLVYH